LQANLNKCIGKQAPSNLWPILWAGGNFGEILKADKTPVSECSIWEAKGSRVDVYAFRNVTISKK
jgi:hypothetical protein